MTAGRHSHEWGAVVCAKALARAKSRLRTLGHMYTADLVTAMLEDMLIAVAESVRLGPVVVVTSDETLSALADFYGASSIPDPGDGLNAAFRAGFDRLGKDINRVVYLPADVPCMTGERLDVCLGQAEAFAAAVVPDAEGTGSTLLTHRAGWWPGPRFGPDSLSLHIEDGAEPLWSAHPAMRRDVDTPADLVEAVRLGVGRHTGAAYSRLQQQVSA